MSYTSGSMTVGIEPHLFVVFGGTGDLAHKKLLPALYHLLESREFDDTVEILAVAQGPLSDEEYRQSVVSSLEDAGYENVEDWCTGHIHYQAIDEGFEAL